MKNFILKYYVFVNSHRDQRNEYSCKIDSFSSSRYFRRNRFSQEETQKDAMKIQYFRNYNIRLYLDYFDVVSYQNEHGSIMTADDDRLNASCNRPRAKSEFKYVFSGLHGKRTTSAQFSGKRSMYARYGHY